MSSASSREFRERLIDEVKKYPVLYDTRHDAHRDIDARDRCWQDIAARLGATSEALKREWKILRDSLRQSLKKSGAAGHKRWRFHSRMAFVLPHMTARRSRRLKPERASASPPPAPASPPSPPAAPLSPAADHDALELFFASVCQSSKRLPARLQAALKRQVLDALLAAEDQLLHDHLDAKPAPPTAPTPAPPHT